MKNYRDEKPSFRGKTFFQRVVKGDVLSTGLFSRIERSASMLAPTRPHNWGGHREFHSSSYAFDISVGGSSVSVGAGDVYFSDAEGKFAKKHYDPKIVSVDFEEIPEPYICVAFDATIRSPQGLVSYTKDNYYSEQHTWNQEEGSPVEGVILRSREPHDFSKEIIICTFTPRDTLVAISQEEYEKGFTQDDSSATTYAFLAQINRGAVLFQRGVNVSKFTAIFQRTR